MWQVYIEPDEKLPKRFPDWSYHSAFPPTMFVRSCCSASCQLLVLPLFFNLAILTGGQQSSSAVVIGISLMTNNIKHILMFLSAFCVSSVVKCLFQSFTHFFKLIYSFLLLSFEDSLYIPKLSFDFKCTTSALKFCYAPTEHLGSLSVRCCFIFYLHMVSISLYRNIYPHIHTQLLKQVSFSIQCKKHLLCPFEGTVQGPRGPQLTHIWPQQLVSLHF